MSNWKAGMKAHCVKSHRDGAVIAGQTHAVGGVSVCACGATTLDVGVPLPPGFTHVICSCGQKTFGSVWWIASFLFRPYEPLKEEMDRIEEAFVSAPAEVETVPA